MDADLDLQETVEQLVGAGAQILDCEKSSVVREEEVLLVNGQPLHLQGQDGAAIRKALLAGHVPPHDLLNTVLENDVYKKSNIFRDKIVHFEWKYEACAVWSGWQVRAGILRSPVRLETSLQVKSSVVTREEVTVARGGRVVDERSRQTQEDNVYNSSTTETWEPAVGVGASATASAHPAGLARPPAPGTAPGTAPAAPAPPPQLSRHGKSQAAPPPPLQHAAAPAAPAAPKCGSPLSSSSSSGFWSPGPGGPAGFAPSRSVSDSSCGSGPAGPPPAPPPAPPPHTAPGPVDEVDATALVHDMHAVSIVRTTLKTQ
ncbi:ATP-dependent helicase brm, partial [Frankliniella fusca]